MCILERKKRHENCGRRKEIQYKQSYSQILQIFYFHYNYLSKLHSPPLKDA